MEELTVHRPTHRGSDPDVLSYRLCSGSESAALLHKRKVEMSLLSETLDPLPATAGEDGYRRHVPMLDCLNTPNDPAEETICQGTNCP